MAGRALAFSDPDIIRMATRDYVPVAADDWYERRRQDAEGKFFRLVADQGPRKGEGGSTRQGIYCCTADGQLLAYKNAGHAPEVMRATLHQGLRAWKDLPAARRRPGAVQVGDREQTDRQYARTPPPRGLIVNVYTRILDRAGDGWRKGTIATQWGDLAARDHLWLREAEWKSLIPAQPREGDRFPLPSQVAERILRFHLIDNTRGEPPMWRHQDIRSQQLTLTVEKVTPTAVRLRLDGSALLATDADIAKAGRGFDVSLLGWIDYDRQKKQIDRLKAVAVGNHWGEGTFTGGARPGRQPLGVAFELARGDSPADLVPPQAAREIGAYFNNRAAR